MDKFRLEAPDGRDRLKDFIKELRLERLLDAYSHAFQMHAAIVGLNYESYTKMAGPQEEGIFYDIMERNQFRKQFELLNKSIQCGQKNKVLMMSNPLIKLSGVPIFYQEQHIATCIVCCLEDRETEEILEAVQFMRILTEVMGDYYSKFINFSSKQAVVHELYMKQKEIDGKETLLSIYRMLTDSQKDAYMPDDILKLAAEYARIDRVMFFEVIPGTEYARCRRDWYLSGKRQIEPEEPHFTVQELRNPADIHIGGYLILDSVHMDQKYRDIYEGLCCKAAVLLPIAYPEGPEGFVAFIETAKERIFYPETVDFFVEVKKIIEKSLLKSP